MRYLFVLVCILITAGVVNAAVIFEDNSTFISYLNGTASVGIETADTYQGTRAIRVTVPGGVDAGQVYNATIPGVHYRVVANPVAANEVRWVMYVWKKVAGSDALMVQFANAGQWGAVTSPIVSPPAPVYRYAAGDNPTGWSAVRVAWQAPRTWAVVIRDLYADFGQFTLTGLALTPFDGVALYDSIYLAKSYNEILDMYQQGAQAKVVVDTVERINENDYFTVKVRIENGYNIAGFEMELVYNTDVLKAYNVLEGGFLSANGAIFWLDPDIDRGAGRIRQIAVVTTPIRGVNGNGVLLAVTFKARDPGESYIRLENVKLLDTQGQVVPAQVVNALVLVAEFPRWDVNRDGRVDILDFIAIARYYGQLATDDNRHADVDEDGRVNVQDLVLVGRHYGDVYWSGAPSVTFLPPTARMRLMQAHGYLVRDGGDEASIKLVENLLEKLPAAGITTWGAIRTGI